MPDRASRDKLAEYRAKRQASRTPEPFGGAALAARYRRALAIAGVESAVADADATPRGLARIAVAARIA